MFVSIEEFGVDSMCVNVVENGNFLVTQYKVVYYSMAANALIDLIIVYEMCTYTDQ